MKKLQTIISSLYFLLLLVGWSCCKHVVRITVDGQNNCCVPSTKDKPKGGGGSGNEIRNKIISKMCKGSEMDGLHKRDCDTCQQDDSDSSTSEEECCKQPTKPVFPPDKQHPSEKTCPVSVTSIETSGCDGCKCLAKCIPNVVMVHSKVIVKAPLCDHTKTIYTTKTFLIHTTHTRTQQAVQWITGHQDHYCTSHTTTIIPVTVESVKTKFVTRPCTSTVLKVKSAMVTSTREFVCIENRPVTNTTVVIETSMIPTPDCTTTEIETVYE